MLTVLWILWRIVIPAIGVLFEGGLVYSMVVTMSFTSGFDAVMSIISIITVMVLIALIVCLIEGWFWVVYRIMLPTFMGGLGLILAGVMIVAISYAAHKTLQGNEVFGSMNFYAVMLQIGILILAETLWIALIFVIQGLPNVSLYCLIGGGGLIALGLVVTFIYWIIAMLIYFFAHHYKIFFIVLGSVLGAFYTGFLIIYAIIKRDDIKDIIEDNLNKYWRWI